MGNKTVLEDMLAQQIFTSDLPAPKRHYRFHPVRQWEADFCWPNHKIIVEVEGGTWIGGRHVNPIGFAKDCEKYNTATVMGFQVLRFVGKMIEDYTAINTIKAAFSVCGDDSSDKRQLDLPTVRQTGRRRSRNSAT